MRAIFSKYPKYYTIRRSLKMTKLEKALVVMSVVIATVFGVLPNTSAMHIMEGFLPPFYSVAWSLVALPFIVIGLIKIKNIVKDHRRVLIILAMVGAYAFALSALKIPSVTGSSSHPTGTALSAIMFGPFVTSVIGLVVLLFQALLLAHGGLTTLGANTFSAAVAGPIVAFVTYKLFVKMKWNKNIGVFLAAFLANVFTYCMTSFQLALAHPSQTGGVMGSFTEFIGIFAITQVPLAIVEGLLTVVVLIGLKSYAAPELKEIGFAHEGAR